MKSMMRNALKHLGNWVHVISACTGKLLTLPKGKRVIVTNGLRKGYAHARIVPTIIPRTAKGKVKVDLVNPHLREWKVAEVVEARVAKVGVKAKAAAKIAEDESRHPQIRKESEEYPQVRLLGEFLPKETEIDHLAING